jgi:hypothetical protein
MVFRRVFLWFAMIWTPFVFVPLVRRMEPFARWLVGKRGKETDVYHFAIDLYKMVFTFATAGIYILLSLLDRGYCSDIIAAIIGVIALCRFCDVVGTFCFLFFTRPSLSARSSLSFRPVVNTVWSIFDGTLLFAVGFQVVEILSSGSFRGSNEDFRASWVTPLYFSFVTISTIGYGDFVPVSPIARMLCIAEVSYGLLMTVAIIQMALSRTPARPEESTPRTLQVDQAEPKSVEGDP